ncbi:leptomycin B resistance protein pmd1 [Lentithecium fluviatile CBS 122367]|uniref:Leptomycin B resistance protein pmd1 n=1 Tax=Lentithecium fluviatile CBS 122367 TaxID=1168545 RepID=A0A6G1J158_9PLEO|nr:leptomycin B resistance protein pmd1 [Lentithecium fluviatile CBS 122367]
MGTSDDHPLPPSASVVSTPADQIHVAEEATMEKQRVAEAADKDGRDGVVEKEKKPEPALKNYIRVYSYGTKLDALLMGLSCLTSIGAGIAMPLMNIVFGQLVDAFTDYFLPDTTITKQEFQASINEQALYIVYLFIGKFCLSYISMLTVRISGLRMSAALRLAYLRATFAQPVSVIDTVSPGKVSTRITTSANTIQLGISQHFAMMFQSLAFTISLYIIAFVKSWLLTLIASASLPFILIVYGTLAPPFMKIHKVTEEHHEEASALAFEIFSSIRIVVAFGAEAKLARKHEAFLEKAAKNEKKAAPLMGMMLSPSMMAMYGTYALTFWFGIRQYSRGKLTSPGDIVVVLFSVMMAVMNIGRLAGPIIALVKAATAATEVFATIDAKTPDTSGFKDPDVSADLDISFHDVAFSYPSRPNVQILDGFSARFEAGKVTAIVGPSGSGKSTIVSLIQRWYDLLGTTVVETTIDKTKEVNAATLSSGLKKDKRDKKKRRKANKSSKPDEGKEEIDLGPNTCTGSVRIGDVDVRNVDLKWFRSQIGLVQQEPFLFNDTLYNNVAFGLCGTLYQEVSKDEKMAMVKEACKEAHADEFIDRLPQGYDTFVGESGIKLSGGQRQRIAIARSIVKKPPILILDEATSAIDVRTERIVQAALDRVSQNRTTIVIAHRLSTIKAADKIMVMRHGKLVEEGRHEELVKIEDGIYYGLVHAQELTMEAEEDTDFEDATLQNVKTADTEKSDAAHASRHGASTDDKEYEKKSFLASGGRLIVEQRHHWLLYTVTILGILVAGAVYPLQAYIFANVMQVFTMTGPDFVTKGYFWSGMYGVQAGAVFVAYTAIGFCTHMVSISITRRYRQEYLNNIIRKRIPFFDAEGHSAGSLTSSLSSDSESLQQLMSTEMSLASISVFNLIGSTIIAFVYGWKLSLVGLFCALPPILAAGYLRLSLEMKFEEMNAAVFAESSQFATEAVGAFRTVLSLIMEDMICTRYQMLLRQHVSKAFVSARLGTIVFAASDSVELACMALTFWYGGTLLASREYGMDDFFVIYIAIVQGAVAAGMWFSVAPNVAQATGAANRILSMRPLRNAPPPSHDAIQNPSGSVGIEFRNVFFTYKSRDTPVLSNLNIKVAPGQFAALVGASGCGKSTSISLLERFYDATSGAVLYNGQDITSLDPAEYRKNISLVSQESTLYEGTIRDNIALSVDSPTDAEIEQACADAQIHEFITSLPDGYNTRLGPKGLSLSGGQKQRLSLARALLRQPKLLLLDEATSSLDSESEKMVQAAIERAAGEGGRTIIAVAHRLATVQKADVIFVLGSGKVLEKGDHQALLRKKGVYYQMCQAQALDR